MIEYGDEHPITDISCRSLMAAVLERALRDIGDAEYVEEHIFRSALKWFHEEDDGDAEHFTYRMIVQVLSFRPSHIAMIENLVRTAEEKREKKRAELRALQHEQARLALLQKAAFQERIEAIHGREEGTNISRGRPRRHRRVCSGIRITSYVV